MLKKIVLAFTMLSIILIGCSSKTPENSLEKNIEITKLSKDCYVVLNKNEKYDSTIKLSKSKKNRSLSFSAYRYISK